MKKLITTDTISQQLTPGLLTEMGVISSDLNIPPGSDFNSSNKLKYRIWTTYGRRKKGNYNNGYLGIELREGKLFVNQYLVNSTKKNENRFLVNEINAEIEIENNFLASPLSWNYKSTFFDETKETNSKILKKTISESAYKFGRRPFNEFNINNYTSNWSLIYSIKNWKKENLPNEEFDIIENLSVVKKDNKIVFNESVEERWSTKLMVFDKYKLVGRGIMPFTFWLDEAGFPLLITSGYLALIFDPTAQNFEYNRFQDDEED
ncbi:MAG: hypothetical protein K9J12_11895 [Melioribacteraceae bacterium]|nr:hypothetical protein [Melioribacteraceae bacterium]MCF8262899.1 hypothetical protein [Melioribacteraceae bacterium]MCF8430921.1 hypothetical protein [Melioribacteraceae bacterium]